MSLVGFRGCQVQVLPSAHPSLTELVKAPAAGPNYLPALHSVIPHVFLRGLLPPLVFVFPVRLGLCIAKRSVPRWPCSPPFPSGFALPQNEGYLPPFLPPQESAHPVQPSLVTRRVLLVLHTFRRTPTPCPLQSSSLLHLPAQGRGGARQRRFVSFGFGFETGSHYVAPAGLEFRGLPASAS